LCFAAVLDKTKGMGTPGRTWRERGYKQLEIRSPREFEKYEDD
jgi:hypothetical protein